jgi:hypothetical protein
MRNNLTPRSVAFSLSLALSVPGSAFALRTPAAQEAGGLEELTHTLAGLEQLTRDLKAAAEAV